MRKNQTTIFFFALVFLVPLLAYTGYRYYERKFQQLPVYGAAGTEDTGNEHSIPVFNLINQGGDVSGTDEWENNILVVDFFFTHCPVVCPKMTNNLKKVQEAFGTNEILIRSISVDPVRDSVATLKRYVVKTGIDTTNWDLLTGSKKEIYKLARNGFFIVATDGDGGEDDFIHSEKLVLIDGRRRIRGYYNGTDDKEVGLLIEDIKKLQHEN